MGSNTTASPYAPDEYEKRSYYNGIAGDGDHPVLSLRGVFGTPLNEKWPIVGPAICAILKDFGLRRWSVDPARFFTHGPVGDEAQGKLGPVVIWIGVMPGSTTPDLAHQVSQKILALLQENGISDVVVEFREAETQQLLGPPLLRPVGSLNATHHVRGFLATLHGVPLTTSDWEADDGQGTLTLCHVLHRDTTTEYKFKGDASQNSVYVCGARRFQQGLDDIAKALSDHSTLAEYYARDIAKLQAMEQQDEETKKELRRLKAKLEEEKESTEELESFQNEVTKHWSDQKLQREIGYVEFAPAISIADDSQYTSDWGVFIAAEAKVKPHFEGNVVDLGSKYSPQDLHSMFYPVPGGRTTFKFPDQRKLRIVACATEDDLAHPAELDTDGLPFLMVGKVGNTTGLTVGRYAGIVSFLENDAGVVSRELGIYNTGLKVTEPFSEKGDSGSLVWLTRDGQAHMVKAEYKHADFYRSSWSA
ncbi:hypothetical protein PYCCODRAFT_1467706 [Trametes coccinea BRFM310]|uniref:Uncharacterized protein n=1 Tax=Trametes coccinea (strain BRFM310) TaxID=1353009 RepID=A0A1Y2IPS2_TRAC3|nr:hypothetical protein PYCCODRAFT_1467706 [Trametes coccinea BRFM310]